MWILDHYMNTKKYVAKFFFLSHKSAEEIGKEFRTLKSVSTISGITMNKYKTFHSLSDVNLWYVFFCLFTLVISIYIAKNAIKMIDILWSCWQLAALFVLDLYFCLNNESQSICLHLSLIILQLHWKHLYWSDTRFIGYCCHSVDTLIHIVIFW